MVVLITHFCIVGDVCCCRVKGLHISVSEEFRPAIVWREGGEREGGRKGGRGGKRYGRREGEKGEGWKEGRSEGGREEGREEGKEGGERHEGREKDGRREGGREGGRERRSKADTVRTNCTTALRYGCCGRPLISVSLPAMPMSAIALAWEGGRGGRGRKGEDGMKGGREEGKEGRREGGRKRRRKGAMEGRRNRGKRRNEMQQELTKWNGGRKVRTATNGFTY